MKRVLGAVAIAAMAAGAWPLSARAAVSEVGWWSRNPTASAPTGGLQVANSLDGVLSFGAIRAGDGNSAVLSATVTLKESGQGVNATGASLQACPAAGTWKPGKGGSFAEAPKADCVAGSVNLTRDASSSTWSGDVTSILPAGDAAIAIVPGKGGGVFELSFDAPGLTVTVAGGSGGIDGFDASEFGGSSSSSSSASPSSSSSSSFDDAGSSSGSGSSSAFRSSPTFSADSSTSFSAEPVTTDAAASTDTTVTDPAASGATETASTPTRNFAQPSAAVGDAGGNRAVQFFAFLLTAAIIGTIAGVARNRLTARLG